MRTQKHDEKRPTWQRESRRTKNDTAIFIIVFRRKRSPGQLRPPTPLGGHHPLHNPGRVAPPSGRGRVGSSESGRKEGGHFRSGGEDEGHFVSEARARPGEQKNGFDHFFRFSPHFYDRPTNSSSSNYVFFQVTQILF